MRFLRRLFRRRRRRTAPAIGSDIILCFSRGQCRPVLVDKDALRSAIKGKL